MQACSTHASAFVHHGIKDGSDLVSRTYYVLAASGHRTPEPTNDFVDRVAQAFRKAFIRSSSLPLIPEPIDAAIDASTDVVIHRVLDDPEADLRTDILPAFYRAIATSYCAHLEASDDPGEVGIWFDDDDEDGIPARSR